jgi:hypothetical protein
VSPTNWEDNPNYNIQNFSELPHSNFGVNQHIVINDEFKEALRQILWQFRAPIRYAFAYGSGVFPQSKVRDILMLCESFQRLGSVEALRVLGVLWIGSIMWNSFLRSSPYSIFKGDWNISASESIFRHNRHTEDHIYVLN